MGDSHKYMINDLEKPCHRPNEKQGVKSDTFALPEKINGISKYKVLLRLNEVSEA